MLYEVITGNAREYLFEDRVRLKKYFYVLRPLLAIRYIEAGLGLPPVRFEELVEAAAPAALREAIEGLLALKRDSVELGLGEPVPALGVITSYSIHYTKLYDTPFPVSSTCMQA